MSRSNEDRCRLSHRDKELVALGAAIASNCIPCIEYHIPQARKVGLSGYEIGQAVALADKVRQVPAYRVLQTASALLGRQGRTRMKSESDECGCSDEARGSGDGTAGVRDDPHVNDVRLDHARSEEDNEEEGGCCGDGANDSTGARGSDEPAAGSRNATDHTGFDFSKMMEMMQGCCPDKAGDFRSMMSGFEKGCCSPNKNANSEEPA